MNRGIPPVRICFAPGDRRALCRDIERMLADGRLTLGEHGRTFEERCAAMAGRRFAIGVSSGTAAIEIALRASGVRGKTVLVPTNTYVATASAVVHAGGVPRFVDVDPRTMCVAVEQVRRRLTPSTVAVIAVHIGGLVSPETEPLRRFCRDRGLFFLEDASHAHGSRFEGRPAGAFGDAAAFSFGATKVVTSAEGGVVVTDDEELWQRAQRLRDHGKSSDDPLRHDHIGHSWRLSEVHAALGASQLARLPSFVAVRRSAAGRYDRLLSEVPGLEPQPIPSGCCSSYYKYVVFLSDGVDRRGLRARIRAEHQVTLPSGVYDLPCHHQPALAPHVDGTFPGAESACGRHLCLPMYSDITDADVDRVVDALHAALGGRRSS